MLFLEDYSNLTFQLLYIDPITGAYCKQSTEIDPKSGEYIYQMFKDDDKKIGQWKSKTNCLPMKFDDLYDDSNFDVIMSYLDYLDNPPDDNDPEETLDNVFEKDPKLNQKSNNYNNYNKDIIYYDYGNIFDYPYSGYSYSNYRNYPLGKGSISYNYPTFKKSTGFLDKLNKSDTLVIHCADKSTDMLSQVYEGKGWDVLTDGNIDPDELHQLLESHDRIVMLGHGTSGGLINVQGPGYVIGANEAPYLKDKKLFAIWCNADGYFKKHGIGNGYFITKNAPSEVWECRAAGCGNISKELMLENITYWCKLCGDVVEDCLEGNVDSSVDYIRKNYLEQYGNHPVTLYNADSAHKLGTDKPLPEYEFKGKPLEPKDYPYPKYNEEEFLKDPKAKV